MRTFKRPMMGEYDSLQWGLKLLDRCRDKYLPKTWCVLFQAQSSDVRGIVLESEAEAEILMKHIRAAKKEMRRLKEAPNAK